jgi:hypothetical protein
MADGERLRVFISYARSDGSAFAEELVAGLEAAGFDPFLDRHDIAPGEDWESRLGNLLQEADTVVYVLTPAWVASDRCKWEVDRAEALHKRLIPVVARDVPEADTPEKLRKLNYIYFSEGHSFGAGLRDLSNALRTDLAWIREHTRLGELAARWRAQGDAEPLQLRGSELESAKAWLQNWKSPAPAPTDLQRALINESETAETGRNSAERKRLDEMAEAQNEKARALRRSARATALLGGVVAVALLATGVFAYKQFEQQRELAGARQQLADANSALTDKQKQLADALAKLDALSANLNTVAEAPAPAIAAQSAPAAQAQARAQIARGAAVQAQVQDFVRQARIALGWDIDVFYCAGPSSAANQAKAQAVYDLLMAERNRQTPSSDLSFALGRIRVRPLSEAINATPQYGIHKDMISTEKSETGVAGELAKFIAGAKGPPVEVEPSTHRSDYYLSVFMCAGA